MLDRRFFFWMGGLMLVTAAALADDSPNLDHAPAGPDHEEVVVTGTRTARLLSEVPVRTEVLSRDILDAAAARSLADAITFTPGVRVLNSCQNCNFTTLSMLGLEGKYSQVLFDSQPLFNSLSMVYGLEQIPADMVERIEVVKGGGSAMYGPGAVGGVVNIIPRESDVSGGHAYVNTEFMDTVRHWSAGFNTGLVSEDMRNRLSMFGMSAHNEAYDRNGDGFSDSARRDMTTFGGRLTHDMDSGGSFSLDYGRVDEDRRGGDNLEAPPFQSDIAEWIRTKRDMVAMNVDHPLGEKADMKVNLSYANTNRHTYYGGGGALDAYGTTSNPLWVVDTQLNHYLGGHTLSWGLQYTDDKLDDDHPGHNRHLRSRAINRGLFVQDDWTLQEHLTLLVGARVDDHSLLEDQVFSPRAALSYKPMESTTVRASYSTGFLAPQVFDEDLHIAVAGGEPQVIFNADDLSEEKSQSYTLGIESTPKVGHGWLLLEANVFHTQLDDAFSLTDEFDVAGTDQVEFTRINSSGASVTGMEATVGYMEGHFEGQVGYVRQKGEYDEAQDFGATDFFRTPNDLIVGKIFWRQPELLNAFLGVKYQGEMDVPHYAGFIAEDILEKVDGMLEVDASLSRDVYLMGNQVTVTLGVRNLLDEFQDDLDEGADRDSGYVYGPRAPRTWYGTLEYGF